MHVRLKQMCIYKLASYRHGFPNGSAFLISFPGFSCFLFSSYSMGRRNRNRCVICKTPYYWGTHPKSVYLHAGKLYFQGRKQLSAHLVMECIRSLKLPAFTLDGKEKSIPLEGTQRSFLLCMSYLLLCNKLPKIWWLKAKPIYCLAFLYTVVRAYLDWILCSGSHKTAVRVSAKPTVLRWSPGSSSKLIQLCGRTQFLML